jgi:hypothetical protein
LRLLLLLVKQGIILLQVVLTFHTLVQLLLLLWSVLLLPEICLPVCQGQSDTAGQSW